MNLFTIPAHTLGFVARGNAAGRGGELHQTDPPLGHDDDVPSRNHHAMSPAYGGARACLRSVRLDLSRRKADHEERDR